MARVITPSGDQVRTVYSSGGFAAGDYVFQTASGFEKAAGVIPWPVKANSAWGVGNSPIGLAFGFSGAADYLLGPSQSGGSYTGSAISFGDNRYANTSSTITSGSIFNATQLSNGYYLLAYGSGPSFTVQVYNSTFTTLFATFTISSGLPQLYTTRLYPDNSGGCVVAGVNNSTGYINVFYVANTSGDNYGISGTSSVSRNINVIWNFSSSPGALAADGILYLGGRDDSSGSNWAWMGKYVYSPRSTSGGTLSFSTFDVGSTVGSTTIVVTKTSFGNTTPYAYMILNWGGNSAFYTLYDQNSPLSSASPNFTTGVSGFGAPLESLGAAVFYPIGTYGSIVFPMISGTSLQFQSIPLNSAGGIVGGSTFKTGTITLASTIGTTISARTSIGLMTSSNLSASNPDLAVYYPRTNGSFQSPYARLITGGLSSGVVPTSSAEVLLNSTTSTSDYTGVLASFNPYSGLIQGCAYGSSFTIQGTAAGSLSTPQPFTYGTSLTPAQTGTCVGVALTAASAGGTGKILVRGTAEVRSTLPNMPGSLSFNHANYGTPGGIRGSVAGRTVTFEGIDG